MLISNCYYHAQATAFINRAAAVTRLQKIAIFLEELYTSKKPMPGNASLSSVFQGCQRKQTSRCRWSHPFELSLREVFASVLETKLSDTWRHEAGDSRHTHRLPHGGEEKQARIAFSRLFHSFVYFPNAAHPATVGLGRSLTLPDINGRNCW